MTPLLNSMCPKNVVEVYLFIIADEGFKSFLRSTGINSILYTTCLRLVCVLVFLNLTQNFYKIETRFNKIFTEILTRRHYG